jgi:hypothetical protein
MFIHKNYTFNRNKYNDKSKVNIEYHGLPCNKQGGGGGIVLVFHNEGHANLRHPY